MDMHDLGARFGRVLLHSPDESLRGAVERIAARMNKSKWLVYDILKGKLKASLEFVWAALQETNGHPEIRALAVPGEFEVWPKAEEPVNAPELEPAALDLHQDLATLTASLRDPQAQHLTPARTNAITRGIDAVERRWASLRAAVRNRLGRGQLKGVKE